MKDDFSNTRATHSNNAQKESRFSHLSKLTIKKRNKCSHAIMDSLANYGSDGENSNNSDDVKMPRSASPEIAERRASDVNYDPVQMDMSEESNNNNSSGDSGSERGPSPSTERRATGSRSETSRHRSSPADQRRSDHDSHSSNSREDHARAERHDRCRRSRESSKSRRLSHDERRRRDSDHSRDSRDSKRSRDDERRKERTSSSSCRDERSSEKDHHHHHRRRDERRDRNRSDRDRRRNRDRRHSGDNRTKDRHRDERSARDHKEKDRTRSRSRSKERVQPQTFRAMSYREEKGRNKLAQLEKLGIELKAPGSEHPVVPTVPGEPNYYNPLATATQGKYAEQIQKRKLLWANKSKADEGKAALAAASTANTWMGTTFTHDQDGKVTAKFKRLMGIKGDLPAVPQPGPKPDILKKQEEMFNNMEQQYEVARATTHTQRGVGLGYASGGYQFPR